MAVQSLAALSQMEQQIGSADWSRWSRNRYCFYDYIQYNPVGSNEMQFFTVPFGSLDPVTSTVKTLEQTNMNESRSFGRVNFLLSQIRTHIRVVPKARQPYAINLQQINIFRNYNSLMNKLADFVNQGTLLITIGQKEYFDISQPFITCPPGFGPDILKHAENVGAAVLGAPAATQALWFVQDNDPDEVYQVRPEQLIEAGQTFVCRILYDNANFPAITGLGPESVTPRVEVGVIFDGYVLRPIQ